MAHFPDYVGHTNDCIAYRDRMLIEIPEAPQEAVKEAG